MRLRLIVLLIFCLASVLRLRAQNVVVSGALVGNGSYATLGAAFAAINGGAQTGATIFVNIIGNTNEGTSSAVLNAGTWTSLTVRPQGGSARTVLGATTPGQGLLHLNGADNVSILGLNSGGNALTIENTTVSNLGGTSTIHLSNDASQNTVDRCSIKGSSVSTGSVTGTVLFGEAGPSTGNDNNTVSFCNIGPSGNNLHSFAILSHVNATAPSRFSSGNTVSQCNIYDYFHATNGSYGVYLSYGNQGWTVSQNRFYQTGVRTQTSPTFHGAIIVSGTYYPTGGNNGHVFIGNFIGGANSNGGGTYSIVGAGNGTSVFGIGIFSSEPAFNSPMIFNNTISNISISGPVSGTGYYAVFSGIRAHDGVPRIGYGGGNVIGSTTNPNSITVNSTSNLPMDVFGIYCNVSTSCVHWNNQIGGISASSTGAGRVYLAGIYSVFGYIDIGFNQIGFASAPLQLNSNNPASALVGVAVQTNLLQCNENTIRSLISSAPNPSTGASAGVIGMRVHSTGTQPFVHRNIIFDLSNSNATAPVSVVGLAMIGIPGSPEGEIYQNDIHSLDVSSTHGGSKITGLHLVSGDHKVSINFIRLGHRANGTSITQGLQIEGIRESAGANSIFHNSVYVGGSSVTDTATSYAFVTTVAQGIRRYYNNIFDNARSNQVLGTGKHFAIGLLGANLQLTDLESNHNVFYAPGTGGKMGRLGAVELGSVSDWQFHTGNELNSVLWNPGFIQPTGSATSGNLRIGTGPTPIEGRGDAARSRYEDFDNGNRSTLTPVDIGADAGLFVPANTGPEIIVRGASMTIFDGDSLPRLSDGTDFDSVAACAGMAVRSFSIENNGTDTLMLNGITFGGVHASDFAVHQLPPPFLIPGGIGNLQVAFSPSGAGVRKAWLYIANDDLDESSYGFVIQGRGTADTLRPQAVCQPVLLYLDHAGQASLPAAQVDGGSNDNCGVDSLAVNSSVFNCNQTGQQAVVLSVWDANGNLDSCLALVNVVDSSAPTILCQSLSLPLDSSGQASLAASQLDAGSTDNCAVDSLAISQEQFDCSHAGPNLVTLRGWDTSGNLDSCTATVTVTESTPPQAACQSIQVILDTNGQATILPAQLDAGSTDNCGIDSMALSQASFDCSDVGSNAVVLSVWDASGNSDTCHATVSIPTVPMAIALEADSFACGHAIRCAGEANGGLQVVVTGGCPPRVYQWSNGATTASLDSLAPGTYTVTVTDGTGLNLQLSRTLTAPAPLIVTTQLREIPCPGMTGGALEATFTGGNACNGYAVAWSNGSTQPSIVGLASGNYTVTIVDASGCQGTDSVNLPSLPLLSPQILQHRDTLYCTAPFRSYQWYRDGQAIPYMRDPWIVPDSSGAYHVEVVDTGGCRAPSNTLWMTSIRDIGQGHFLDNLVLSPNPAQGYVTLVAGDPVRTGVRVGFYDAAGRLIRRMERADLEDQWTIDIHDLSAGIYFLNVSAKNGAYKVLRLVVQN